MHIDTVTPFIFDEAIQAIQTIRLRTWVTLVAQRPSQDLLCRGITKFIEHDLLRYGNWPTTVGMQRTFGAVRESEAVRSFIENEIWPTRPVVAGMLDLLGDGHLVMEAGKRNGRPEFIFWLKQGALKPAASGWIM